jgi:hypothetical protein
MSFLCPSNGARVHPAITFLEAIMRTQMRSGKSVALKTATIGAALAAIVGLSGCSSLPGWSAPQVVDDQKIALVDAWAARNNVTVIWVNQPKRAKPEAASTAAPATPASPST